MNHPPVVRGARIVIPLLFVGLALLLNACGGDAQSKPKLEPVVRPVKLVTVSGGDAGAVREYPGRLAATESAVLAFEKPGKVVEIPVREGEPVERGQLVARIDPQNARSRLDAAVANRNAARSAYERAKQLYERDIVPLQQLEARRRDFEVAESNVETAREALAETRIVAPFAGQVARTHVEINETIGAQRPVVTVQDISQMEVRIDLPEQDQLHKTLRTAPLHVTLAMLPGQRFPAELQEIATTADPTTRTYEATLTFDPPRDVDVLPGMTARVLVGASGDAATAAPQPLDTSTSDDGAVRSVVTVPASAVFSDASGRPTVWVVDGATMQVSRRTVELGELRDTMMTVRSGLRPGDRIAATGVHQLNDGQAVRPL